MRKTAIAATLAAGALAACGGGGGGNGSNGASAPTGAASTPSASNAAIALVAAPGASAGSFTATGDVINDTLAYINHQRAQVGLPALAFQSGVAQAAANHSMWEQDNNVVGHYETSGTPGYTGVSPSDRVNQFHATNSVGEITAGFTGAFSNSTEAIQALFDAPFHRAIMLFDSVYAGPGIATTTSSSQLSTLTVDFADHKPFIGEGQLVAWPYNGMAGVNTGWLANESPNPVASYNNGSLVGAVVGYPVTLSGGDNAAFSNVSFTIADAAGNNMPCVETDSSNNADATREAMCVPIARLAKNTTYTVKVLGSLSNTTLAATPFALSWAFTTAATDNAPIGAPTSAASAQGASGARSFEQVSPRRVILN
ncbi:CAP domain-containing protein [Burkholderia pseudomallei]|uniref:CAP domain-containing protein n=1 Tax=Burkholderia pseudomallei TaxID=28450 RepID=UPI0021F6D78C|nr:CAP domain-containing protein [Burkholderia pseudomallei]MCW0053336.1 CAP domain-containing protein [Burkholderia pseudomallei]